MEEKCGNCGRYDSDNNHCPLWGEKYEEDTCDNDWLEDGELNFKLGQKVSYTRLSRKREINMQFFDVPDFKQDEEKVLKRRELVYLNKKRTGYIVGRRRFVFNTMFSVNNDNYDDDDNVIEFVDIKRQEWGYVYLVACNMRNYDYVLEKDIRIVPEVEIIRF